MLIRNNSYTYRFPAMTYRKLTETKYAWSPFWQGLTITPALSLYWDQLAPASNQKCYLRCAAIKDLPSRSTHCIRNGLVFKDRDDESALDDFNTNNFPTCFLLTQAEPFEPVSLRSSYALDQPIAYQYPIQSWCHLDTEMPRTVQSNDIDQTVNKDQPTCGHLRQNVHHNVRAGLAPAPPFSLRW
jgi:hypothetical protein